ncbi:uncharacterized protein LOC134536948 isoform X2 [Bacillus rossius redtenbacheri]|uniref:uncharacterized protein LOC134536948 isoform X2 n=1 Tax=Bacillus rossius redtenbacheri TaxID=93214 RepID=UPI002FDCF3DF
MVIRTVIMRSVFHRWRFMFGQKLYPVFSESDRTLFYCKRVGKHLLGCRFYIKFAPTKQLFRCTSSDSKDEPDLEDDSEKYVFDSTGLYEDSLRDVSEARQLLYPSSDHPVVKLLNVSSSVQEVFDVLSNHERDIDACSLSQAVLVLWDLQKAFYEVNIKNLGGGAEEHSLLRLKDVFGDYVSQIRSHPSFENLLGGVGRHVHEFSTEALMCTFLHLSKMSVAMHHEVMHLLLSRCLALLEEDKGEKVSLPALSWFIAAVQNPGLWSVYIIRYALPVVFQKMGTCETAADFQLLTACLIGAHRLLDRRRLEEYKALAGRLVDAGELTGRHPRAVLKAAYLLNYPPWSHCNCPLVRRLLLLLAGSVGTLLASDLVHLHRVFTSQLEPAGLLEEMREHASRLLADSDRHDAARLPSQCELLECMVTFSPPAQKRVFEDLASRHLGEGFAGSVTPLFKILRHLKTSDARLCDRFWSLTVDFLRDREEEREDYRLLKICYRYMHFNSHLGGTYRHARFEAHALQWLWEHLGSGATGLVPSKFSQAAGFALAYAGDRGPAGHPQLLELVARRLPGMLPQFSEIDCLNVSRGLQVSMRLQRRGRRMAPQLLWRLAAVNSALDEWSLARLQRRPLGLQDVNLVTKAYMCRRGARNTQLFHQLVRSYEDSDDDLSSRLIRGISVNLLLSRCLLPRTIDRMAEYSVANCSHVMGETFEKLLSLCYSVGYCPASQDAFLSAAAGAVFRDKERMSGMALLQSALALCFFRRLSLQFVYFIFTVDFMERLDQEVAQCYSKRRPRTRPGCATTSCS